MTDAGNIHLRVGDFLMDVHGFNITYEIVDVDTNLRTDACSVYKCSFLGTLRLKIILVFLKMPLWLRIKLISKTSNNYSMFNLILKWGIIVCDKLNLIKKKKKASLIMFRILKMDTRIWFTAKFDSLCVDGLACRMTYISFRTIFDTIPIIFIA